MLSNILKNKKGGQINTKNNLTQNIKILDEITRYDLYYSLAYPFK
jgi:hypothetical protein